MGKVNESSKVKLKEKIDNMLYWSYNLLSNLFFIFSANRKRVKRNHCLKNKHLGERCFILGTGPSLKNTNIDLIKKEIIFGVNFLYKSDLINLIKPQYYCLYDEIFHTSHQSNTIELINKLQETNFILRTKAARFVEENSLNSDRIFFQHCNQYQYGEHIKLDMTMSMTAPFNVILGCLQSAIYMGFNEIFLLGCDYNSFASLKVEHCYDNGKSPERVMSIGFELKYYSMVSFHHYAIEKYAREHGVKIVNLTPNSLLDAYERSSLEQILNI